jgi:outer membrane biosynthesis protein TonB
MDSTVRPRPNHYETLGLTPAASDAEILQAFGREMSMFRARPMSAIAQVSIAYETLRNPAKRRAYDAALGLKAEPEAPRTPAGPPAAFVGAAPRARAEGLPERRLGSFIAEALREPAGAEEASPEPEPEPLPEPEHWSEAESKPDLGDLLAGHRAEEDRAAVAWKRPAIAAGALVAAVGLAGALLGWRGGEAPERAEPDMAIALPEATPPQDIAAVSAPPSPAPDPAPSVAKAPTEPPARPATAAEIPRIAPAPAGPRPAVDELQAAVDQTAESPQKDVAANEAVADSPAVGTTAAALPLPNATVARTIARIGYACGAVASTEAVAGEAGVFKVTCTSGQSYRAAPVRGRYHFRRWAGQ